MVLIEIPDYVWKVCKKSFALMGVRNEEMRIRLLGEDLLQKSLDVIDDAEKQLLDDTPEAYVQREIGLAKEKKTHRQDCEQHS